MLEELGIKRANLYTWFKKVGLDVKELRRSLRRQGRSSRGS